MIASIFLVALLRVASAASSEDSFIYNGKSFDVAPVWNYCLRDSKEFSVDKNVSDYGALLSTTLRRLKADGGGAVRLRDGVYPVTSSIIIQDRTCLLGDSVDGAVLRVMNKATSSSPTRGVVSGDGVKNAVLRDFTVDANKNEQKDTKSDGHLSKFGIFLANVKYLWIMNVRVRGAIAYGIDTPGLDGSTSSHVAIERAVADSCGKDGIKLFGTKMTSVQRSVTVNNGRHGVHVAGSSDISLEALTAVSDGAHASFKGCGIYVGARDSTRSKRVMAFFARIHDAYHAGVCIGTADDVFVYDADISSKMQTPCYSIDEKNARQFNIVRGRCGKDGSTRCPGLERDGACCPASCGYCGGVGCSMWKPRGACCVDVIHKNYGKCKETSPPCVI